MGQSTSVDVQSPTASTSSGRSGVGVFSNELDFLHEQIRKHSLTLRQLTNLTYVDLERKVQDLNELSNNFVDCNGKQLKFDINSGSEVPRSMLWKGLVRIRCMKINPSDKSVERCRDLNLKQFLQLYNTMMQMQGTAIISTSFGGQPETEDELEEWDNSIDVPSDKISAANAKSRNIPKVNMSASRLFDDIKSPADSSDECCICMESKPQVSLPCAHSYCLACIEQWNVNHKTCPICREDLRSTDETWVLEDKPEPQDVQMEIKKSLFELTK